MDEDRYELPPLPAGAELKGRQEGLDFLAGDNWAYNDVDKYLLDFTEPYRPPRYTLSWDGIPFAPLGGMHNITGQSGNGKTMTIAQFMAAILCGQFGRLKYELAEEIPHPRVLYIDTEMEKDNTIAVKNRVLSMADRQPGRKYDDFYIIMLRDVEEVPELDKDGRPVYDAKTGRQRYVNPAVVRWRMLLKAIWQYRPTVVFIDGLIDIVADFNDNIECQQLIFKCMKLASHYDISLWCILHQNPGADKMVGHLGSFLERKVTDVIQTRKEKDKATGAVTFEVVHRKARGRDFDDWKFRVLPVNSWGVPEQIDTAPPKAGGDMPDKVKAWLAEIQTELAWPATGSEIKDALKAHGFEKNNGKLQECITVAKNRRFILEQEMEPGQRHPKYKLNLAEFDEMPF